MNLAGGGTGAEMDVGGLGGVGGRASEGDDDAKLPIFFSDDGLAGLAGVVLGGEGGSPG